MPEEYDRVMERLAEIEKTSMEDKQIEMDLKIASSGNENFFHEDDYNKAVEKINRIVTKITSLEKEQKGKPTFFLHEKNDEDNSKIAVVKNFEVIADNTYSSIFKKKKKDAKAAEEIKDQPTDEVSGNPEVPKKTKAADQMQSMWFVKVPESIRKDILKAVDGIDKKIGSGAEMIDSVMKLEKHKKSSSIRPEDLSPLDQINLLNKIIDDIGKGEIDRKELEDYSDIIKRIKKNAAAGNAIAVEGADSYVYKMREERIEYAEKALDSYASTGGYLVKRENLTS
jgi:hypothetical protein